MVAALLVTSKLRHDNSYGITPQLAAKAAGLKLQIGGKYQEHHLTNLEDGQQVWRQIFLTLWPLSRGDK